MNRDNKSWSKERGAPFGAIVPAVKLVMGKHSHCFTAHWSHKCHELHKSFAGVVLRATGDKINDFPSYFPFRFVLVCVVIFFSFFLEQRTCIEFIEQICNSSQQRKPDERSVRPCERVFFFSSFHSKLLLPPPIFLEGFVAPWGKNKKASLFRPLPRNFPWASKSGKNFVKGTNVRNSTPKLDTKEKMTFTTHNRRSCWQNHAILRECKNISLLLDASFQREQRTFYLVPIFMSIIDGSWKCCSKSSISMKTGNKLRRLCWQNLS